MKKAMIVAALLIAVGLIVCVIGFAVNGFSFDFLIEKTEVRTALITDDITDIYVTGSICKVQITESSDEQIKVVLRETDKIGYEISAKDGKLDISEENRKKWYDFIGFSFESTEVLVYLPEAEYGDINVKVNTGIVNLDGVCVSDIRLTTDTGAVTVSADVNGDVYLESDTGKVSAKLSGTPERVEISCDTGSVSVNDTKCNSLDVQTATGRIELSHVICRDKLNLEADTGDIKLTKCDATEIKIETDTGDVTGTLLSEKDIYAESDTGRVDVPRSVDGGRCVIETDTGNINVKYVK